MHMWKLYFRTHLCLIESKRREKEERKKEKREKERARTRKRERRENQHRRGTKKPINVILFRDKECDEMSLIAPYNASLKCVDITKLALYHSALFDAHSNALLAWLFAHALPAAKRTRLHLSSLREFTAKTRQNREKCLNPVHTRKIFLNFWGLIFSPSFFFLQARLNIQVTLKSLSALEYSFGLFALLERAADIWSCPPGLGLAASRVARSNTSRKKKIVETKKWIYRNPMNTICSFSW